jgi:CRISPR-associated protein Cas1
MNDLVCLVDRRGSSLEFEAGVLTVRTPDEPAWRVGARQLGLLVVHGRVVADTTVWRGLADAGVAVALTGGRHGDDVAWLGAGLSTSGALRQRQHLAHADPAARLANARWVLEGKIAAMRAELEHGWLAQASRVESAIVRAEGTLALSRSTATLNGIEGALAADWFGAMAASVEPAWGFTGRNRRPPRDPLNALLSYGYALAGAEALAAVQRLGFDPAVGFLHDMYPGRHALALDALECLRPMVDALAVRLLWSDLDPVQFSADATRGCRLDKDARLAVVKGWHALREQGAHAALSRWTHALRQRLGAAVRPEADERQGQDEGGSA